MKLSECTIGTVVSLKSQNEWNKDFRFYPAFLGHITGFDNVPTDTSRTVIVIVNWCDGSTSPINPANIELFED